MKTSVLALAIAPVALACWSEADGKSIQYSSVPGFFLQDDPKTNQSTFDYADWNFGLINRTYSTDKCYDPHGHKTQWQRFARYVTQLNHDSRGSDTQYKVLVMGRHGEGWHNAAESYYGTPAWNCYWGELDGNGTAVWSDAGLTDAGFAQAYKANAYFKSRFEEQGMPYFQSYYSSPLTRCLSTANATFANLTLPPTQPFVPTIKELFRESISIHTCDRRSNKTYIHNFVPSWHFEPGFSEFDQLWRGTEGETSDHQFVRSNIVLDEVFKQDASTWISITSHSGEIGSILEVLNHQAFSLATGQIIPVLVKAKVIPPEGPTSSYVGFTAEATCNAPPVTSLASGGCVCSSTTVASAPATKTTAA